MNKASRGLITQAEINSYEYLISWTTSRWVKEINPNFGINTGRHKLKYGQALRSNTITGHWEHIEDNEEGYD